MHPAELCVHDHDIVHQRSQRSSLALALDFCGRETAVGSFEGFDFFY
jgi:hypothetical protein